MTNKDQRSYKTGVTGVYKRRNSMGTYDAYFSTVSPKLSDGKNHTIYLPSQDSIEKSAEMREYVKAFIEKNKKENKTKYCTLTVEEIKAYAKSYNPMDTYTPKYLSSKRDLEEKLEKMNSAYPKYYLKPYLLKVFCMTDEACVQPGLYFNPADFFKLVSPVDFLEMRQQVNTFIYNNPKDYNVGKIYSQEELLNSNFTLMLENTKGQLLALPIFFSDDIDIDDPIMAIPETMENKIKPFLSIDKINTRFNLITSTYISLTTENKVSKDSNIYGSLMYKPDAMRIILKNAIHKNRS